MPGYKGTEGPGDCKQMETTQSPVEKPGELRLPGFSPELSKPIPLWA